MAARWGKFSQGKLKINIPPPIGNKVIKKSIAVASLGTLIEYYDYSIFSMFLPFLAPVFFAQKNDYQSLVMGFYAILITQIARPIGGLVFGMIGDKYGRRTALIISMYGIAFATLGIGLLPGFTSIGIYSIFLLIIIRSVQMLCYGGEYSGAGIYVVELSPSSNSGAVGAILSAMALAGSVMSSLIGMVIIWSNNSHPNWRLAFIIGGIFGLITIYWRTNMQDSTSHEQLSRNISFFKLVRQYPKQLFAGICIGGFITTPFTTILVFVNPILKLRSHLNNTNFMSLQFLLSVVAVISLLVSGLLADKFTSAKTMKLAAKLLIILAIPLCYMLDSKVILIVIIAEVALIILNELLFGPSNAFLKQIFPVSCRYRGVAFSFALGMSLIGGLTPIVEDYLYKISGHMSFIAIWLILISCLTYVSLKVAKPIH
ncbi:MAG: proline/betaine transporter [Burkholderiales bacterium]|jgi:MHS family proline/betaine transporter-like MFS transporter|nr:proline/betaine transporter [Burkholderiales bacterium]